MKQIIIYGSKYGATESYAKKLAELTGVECHSYKERVSLKDYDRIIYMGGVFAGLIKGLKSTARTFPKDKEIIVLTVGIIDTTIKANVDYIKKTALEQMPEGIRDNTRVYCLLGCVDYSKLSFVDKMLMTIVVKGLSNKSVDERTENESALIDNYNYKTDLVDFSSLNEIVDIMNN